MPAFADSAILIVDDEPANVRLLERVLAQSGYRKFHGITDPRETLAVMRAFQPDLILLDLLMPHVDGYTVLKQIAAELDAGDYLPILVLTADVTPRSKQRALTRGARDFLTKPFDLTEVLLRISNLLETRHLHMQLRKQNAVLEERVRERTAELERAQSEILGRLALAAEYRDDATGEHARRVGKLCERLALTVGIAPGRAQVIGKAALLHDLGKIGIPDAILLKPTRLTGEEMQVMRTHTTIGARILSGSGSTLLRTAELIALTHHERWDGSGYPAGLSGEDIPVEGRIVAIVDAFDAMVFERPYHKAMPIESAREELRVQRGRHFDAQIVDAFLGADTGSLLRLTEAIGKSEIVPAGSAELQTLKKDPS